MDKSRSSLSPGSGRLSKTQRQVFLLKKEIEAIREMACEEAAGKPLSRFELVPMVDLASTLKLQRVEQQDQESVIRWHAAGHKGDSLYEDNKGSCEHLKGT